jgi:DNA invertase Pin-like site-specific DNA recombinase
MRAVIYARYSSELQRDASIEDQVRSCKARIAGEGWTLVCTYTDHAQSGASHLRPGYQQLLADARAGRIDVVVAEALDRLSRDQEHVAGFFKQLTFCGVKIITLAEGEISELHVGLKGTMNALFLKDLAQKTRRGLEGRVGEGRSGGGLCFGYDVLRETDARGEAMAGGRGINQVEAAIVQRIFQAYADGRSPRAIARALNAESIRGPFGGTWGQSTITGNASRGTGILNNELYIGKLVWNRLRYTKDPMSGKRRSRLNPAECVDHSGRAGASNRRRRAVAAEERPPAGASSCDASRPARHAVFLGATSSALSLLRAGEVRLLRRQLHRDQQEPLRLCPRARPWHLQQSAQRPPRRPRGQRPRRPQIEADGPCPLPALRR